MPTIIPYIQFFLLLGAFITTYILMPRIIAVVRYRRLMDEPNARSSHGENIPSLGGVAFFITIVLGLYFLQPFDEDNKSMALVSGLVVLFIIGLKDDLTVISPVTKLVAQLVAVSFLLFNPSFQIDNLHGFMGIWEISKYITTPLLVFVLVVIINAYNLIDGIDGLAGIVGVVIFSIMSYLFYLLNMPFFLGVNMLMLGTLLAFLRFNFSSKLKIFMGDTGSMIVGFIVAASITRIFVVPSNQLNALPFQAENLPLVILALLLIPFLDTTRVFFIRLRQGKSPFRPDRNHIHHLLIDYLHFSHKQASVFIGVINLHFVTLFMFFATRFNERSLLIVMALTLMVFFYLLYRIDFSVENLQRRMRMRNQFKRLSWLRHLF